MYSLYKHVQTILSYLLSLLLSHTVVIFITMIQFLNASN